MKIIGGQFKGRNFYMPEGIRPTQNVVRAALFNLLGHDLDGVTFLELFAGSGAVGLEAFSRGASYVMMVERDAKCAHTIEENITLVNTTGYKENRQRIDLKIKDAFVAIKELAEQNAKFDIIFLDPPFRRGLTKKILKTLEAYDIVQPNCTVVVQHETSENLPKSQGRFCLYKQHRYGGSYLSFYQPQTAV